MINIVHVPHECLFNRCSVSTLAETVVLFACSLNVCIFSVEFECLHDGCINGCADGL